MKPLNQGEKKREPTFVLLYRSIIRHPDLSCTAKAVYAAVKSYADANGYCYPPRWRLAANCGIKSLKTLDTALEELKQFGILFWSKGSAGRANEYHLTDKQCHYKLKREEVQKLRYAEVQKLLPKNIHLPSTLQETPPNVLPMKQAKA